MTPITCDSPPRCECCRRLVKETSARPLLLGCDDMLCKDCWCEWYDGDSTNPQRIGEQVRRKFGKHGGTALLMSEVDPKV
jgi:hypothetical protein